VNNGKTILSKQSISLVLFTKNVSRRIKTTTPEKKNGRNNNLPSLEMVRFSGRHQIYDCNQKVFYVSGMRISAGNRTANQQFPLVDDDEIFLYHISTLSRSWGPLYLLGFWLIGLWVSFSTLKVWEIENKCRYSRRK